MRKSILGAFLGISVSLAFILSPVLAASPYPSRVEKTNFGKTSGISNIVSIGNGGYKQAQVTTTTGYQVDLISVKADYNIVNGIRVGVLDDSNKWSTKAYAQLTYDGGKTMECITVHYAKKGSEIVQFNTYDIW